MHTVHSDNGFLQVVATLQLRHALFIGVLSNRVSVICRLTDWLSLCMPVEASIRRGMGRVGLAHGESAAVRSSQSCGRILRRRIGLRAAAGLCFTD